MQHITKIGFRVGMDKNLMLIPDAIHAEIRTFAVIGCTVQTTKHLLIRRVLERNVHFGWHYHFPTLTGKEDRTLKDSFEILRIPVNGILYHHSSPIRIAHQHLFSEIHFLTSTHHDLSFKKEQKYKKYLYLIDYQCVINN